MGLQRGGQVGSDFPSKRLPVVHCVEGFCQREIASKKGGMLWAKVRKGPINLLSDGGRSQAVQRGCVIAAMLTLQKEKGISASQPFWA